MSKFFSQGGSWVLAQAVVLFLVFWAPYLLPGTVTPLPFVLAGTVVACLGGLQAALGAIALGRNLTPLPQPGAGSHLRTTGVYGLVRHPIYGGIVLVAWGQALITRPTLTLAMALLATCFFLLKARREEKWLRAQFEDYESYATRTRRLIPWIL